MSRQKLVFPTSEVFHLWANQTQQEARNAQSNVFYEGHTLYSYRRSFIAAVLFPEHNCCLINSDHYSNTTAGHLRDAYYALDRSIYRKVFYVPLNLTRNCYGKYFTDEIESDLKKAITAKGKKEEYINNAINTVDTAKDYYSIFTDLAIPEKLQNWFNNPPTLTPEQITAHKQQQKQLRDHKKQQQIELQKANEEKIQEWIHCERQTMPYGIDKVYLRTYRNIDGHVVQTSKGATVPYREAKILFRELQQQPPTLGRYLDGKIGNYQIHHLINNVLTIGCHQITMEEVMRFAVSQGWTANSIEINEPVLN